MNSKNIDHDTVTSFGHEWSYYSQDIVDEKESEILFARYFSIFPWNEIPFDAIGFDMGCGTGRWARHVAPRVGHLTCIDPAQAALEVAKRNLSEFDNVSFENSTTSDTTLHESSQDFGYSLGVLHHIPDTQEALRDCVKLLKTGSPFLVYLYYRFDNRPVWFRLIWLCSDLQRLWISRLPNALKNIITDAIALGVYWPLARLSALAERAGVKATNLPLYAYRNMSSYTMRTDARDRFGTPLEKRFTRSEIIQMMKASGLEDIYISESEPFWCAVGYKI